MTDHHSRQSEFEEKIIQISRVSKKTKGGNKIGFSVLIVVGDRKGRVGVALGKAPTVAAAIRKGAKKAKKKLITVPMHGSTIPFKVEVKKGAGRVLLKPAPEGSGVIAGGPVRAVVDAAGIRDISSKILGSQNQASSVYATFAALKEIERLVKLKGMKLNSHPNREEATVPKQLPAKQESVQLVEDTQKLPLLAKPNSKITKTTKKISQSVTPVKPTASVKPVTTAKKPIVKTSSVKASKTAQPKKSAKAKTK